MRIGGCGPILPFCQNLMKPLLTIYLISGWTETYRTRIASNKHRYGCQWLGRGACEVVKASCLPGKSEIAGSNSALAFRFQKNKCFFHAHSQRFDIVGSLRDRGVSRPHTAGVRILNHVSSHSFRHPQEVPIVQFSLYVHRSGLNPPLFVSDWIPTINRSLRNIELNHIQ